MTTDFSEHGLVYVPHPALEHATPPLETEDPVWRQDLLNFMWDTMIAHKGIGLAANQINLNASVFVIKEEATKQPLFCINPAIHTVGDEKELMLEGCLSDPGLYLKVKRPASIVASWQEIDGKRTTQELQGLNARVFLHEYDHLCGVHFTDRVGDVKLKAARKKQRKILGK